VAEGIELVHESHKLQALGCDVGQGYLYAKPMAKEHLIGTMRRRLVGGAPPVPVPERRLSGLIPGFGKG
jgi:predicted signal transduction protein with EAL and GGDEF domain